MENSMGLTKEQKKRKKIEKWKGKADKAEQKIYERLADADRSTPELSKKAMDRANKALGLVDLTPDDKYDQPDHRIKPRNLKLRRSMKKISKLTGEENVHKPTKEQRKTIRKSRRIKLRKKK